MRYDKRFQKFKQNQLFRTNHKLFYEHQMKTKKRLETELLNPMKPPPFGVKSGGRKLVTTRRRLGWRTLSRRSEQQRRKKL